MSEPFAVVGFLERDGKVCAISRRNRFDDLGFPGGKIDPDEKPEDTLVRELWEEIGVQAIRFEKVFEDVDAHDDLCWMYRIFDWVGEPYAKEGDAAVLWVIPEKLLQSSCSFANYNRAALRALRS